MTLQLRPRVVGAFVTVAAAGAACSTTNDIAGVGDGPDVSIADISIPDISIPEITISDISIPDISIPDISIPDISIPDISLDGFVFDAPGGDYRITFPAAPSPAELPVALPGGTVAAEAFVFQDGADAAYLTSAFDFAEDLEGDVEPDTTAVLEGARDGAIATMSGTLASSEFVEQRGVSGVAFTFTTDVAGAPGVGSGMLFFDDPRLYQSFALGVPEGAADYDAFVDTFEFTGAGS